MAKQSFSPRNYALYLLNLRDRSSGEIRAKMAQKKFPSETIEEVLTWLEEIGILNDERFAQNLAKAEMNLRPQGKYHLRMKMRRRHLDSAVIDKALAQISGVDEKVVATEAATRWLARKGNLTSEEQKAKLIRYLSGRGFSWEIVREVAEEADTPNT